MFKDHIDGNRSAVHKNYECDFTGIWNNPLPPPKRNKKQKQKNTHTQNTPIMRVLLFFFLGRGGRLRQIPLCEIEAQIAD